MSKRSQLLRVSCSEDLTHKTTMLKHEVIVCVCTAAWSRAVHNTHHSPSSRTSTDWHTPNYTCCRLPAQRRWPTPTQAGVCFNCVSLCFVIAVIESNLELSLRFDPPSPKFTRQHPGEESYRYRSLCVGDRDGAPCDTSFQVLSLQVQSSAIHCCHHNMSAVVF